MKKILFPLLIFILSFTACESSQNQHYTLFEIQEGDSMTRITARLIDAEILTKKLPFRIYAKITGQDSKLKIGTYNIPPQRSYQQILAILTSGKGIGNLVTIPEGFNIYQIAALLEEKEIVSAQDFLNEVYHEYWLKQFNLPTNPPYTITNISYFYDQNNFRFAVPKNPPLYSLEGYLFPDTYSFEKNSSAKTVVQVMTSNFHAIMDNTILTEIKKQNKSLSEVITLASIIQKESSSDKEMPKVAGVYNNRLKINMILQADPTLIYALILDGEYDGNIRSRHLNPPWSSPYNTYYRTSLPPGAIANPGKSAILATLQPEKHDYFYFVATPNGGHKYSRTYAEHQKAVQDWVNYRRGRS
ncbi:MAG: endolytic transglycosylase MltG [Brevinema sp.]